MSFGNSGYKSRRSKYERGNRGAMKRSNNGSFITDLSSATGKVSRESLRNRTSSAITAATLNGREISPINEKRKYLGQAIPEDSDEA